MMAKKYFKPGCTNEVERVCKCSSPETLLCKEHIGEHKTLPNRAHNLESIFMQPFDGSIELANVKDSISLIINENSESLKWSEEQNAIKKALENEASSQIRIDSNDLSTKLKEAESTLNIIDTLRNKTAEILSRPNNPEFEIDFRTTCSAIQTNSCFYDPPIMQAYQDYENAYQQKTSLYNVTRYKNRTNLIIYNTETETKEVKTLQTPEPLDCETCITRLPNGKLFCFGKDYPISGIAVLIDVNGEIKVLPSGTTCLLSSCIYFNNSVYCFGGYNKGHLTLSSRFDLDQNRWIQLTPMPKSDYRCSSIIFNGNILISGYDSRNLLLYSIDIDSFSTIPYEFEENKIKILINAERLYLIESPGSIYESEIGIYSNWRQIGNSTIDDDCFQVNYLYQASIISSISFHVSTFIFLQLEKAHYLGKEFLFKD